MVESVAHFKTNMLTITKSYPYFFRKSAISGVVSGAIAQYIASPADLIKVQIQMEGKRRLMGEPPRYVFS